MMTANEPMAAVPAGARRALAEPAPTSRRRGHRGLAIAIVGVVVSAAAGLGLGLGPTLALYSHGADSVSLGTITAGNLDITMDPDYTWTLTTPANSTTGYAGESVSGGPSDAAQIANLWVSDTTQLTLTYTGTITVTGDNMSANVSSQGIVDGTSQAGAPNSITTGLAIFDSTGASLNPNLPLSAGNYTYQVQAFIFNTTFVQAPRFGTGTSATSAADWTFTLGYPKVTLTQVRS